MLIYHVMPAKSSDTAIVCRFREHRISFMRGSVCLDIPHLHAERSQLLCNLMEQAQVDVDVPLALSAQALQAWKACVKALANPHLDRPLLLSNLGEDTLVLALKVCHLILRAWMAVLATGCTEATPAICLQRMDAGVQSVDDAVHVLKLQYRQFKTLTSGCMWPVVQHLGCTDI